MGRFVGRVAHDFDNVLMGVMGFAELTQPLLTENAQAAHYIDELLRAAQRGLEATRQMHQFSRSGQKTAQPTRLNDFWPAEAMSRPPRLPDGTRVKVDLAPDLPAVVLASEPLRNVLGALVQNAAEAMPAGATVIVTARSVSLTEPPAAVLPSGLRPGPYVELTIADTGPGFRPDVLQRLMEEPFITTKVRHRGLGMAIVLRTLHVHGGGLTIESTPQGSAVRVYLPVATVSPLTPCPQPTSANSLGGNHPCL